MISDLCVLRECRASGLCGSRRHDSMKVLMTMNRTVLSAALLLCTALLAPRPTDAHHSAAMFDDQKVLELKGTVKEMQWKNPHVWIQVVVDDHGKPTEYSLEAGSPNTLSRSGWKATTFKSGDEVTVRMNPMKDGSAAGLFIGAKFAADGKTIGRWD
jgi:Family of unknown function (DUF6152)